MVGWLVRNGDPNVEAAAKAFGRALRDARSKPGLSQAALGERCSLAQSTVSKLESGALRGMRYATLMRVLGALDPISIRIEVQRPGWYAELIARYAGDGFDREGDDQDQSRARR